MLFGSGDDSRTPPMCWFRLRSLLRDVGSGPLCRHIGHIPSYTAVHTDLVMLVVHSSRNTWYLLQGFYVCLYLLYICSCFSNNVLNYADAYFP